MQKEEPGIKTGKILLESFQDSLKGYVYQILSMMGYPVFRICINYEIKSAKKQKAYPAIMGVECGGFDVYLLSDGSVKSISNYGIKMKLLKIALIYGF